MEKWTKYIPGCVIGNVLEFYDFIIYAFFSGIIAELFFPKTNAFVGLLITFGVFASGCIMRPLGALFFGYLGDRYGRKNALAASIILITLATVLMGLLPTYQSVGVWAPILLTICRLFQGVAVSGEEMGAAIYLMENAPLNRQGFAGSLILASVYPGLILGSLTVLTVSLTFSHALVLAWAWRIPFLLSFILGIFALIIRLKGQESPLFDTVRQHNQISKTPIKKLFKHYWRALIRCAGVCAILAVSVYTFVIYLPSYLDHHSRLSHSTCLTLQVTSLCVMSFLVPLMGIVSDKIGAEKLLKKSCVGFIIAAYPIFLLLSYGTLTAAIVAESMLIVLLGSVAGSTMPLLLGLFPINVRFTGVCLSFNVAMTVFGSTAPMIALVLVKFTQSTTAPFIYLVIAAMISLVALRFFGACLIPRSANTEIQAVS